MFGDKPKVIFKKSGIDETIFKYVTEEITQTADIMKNLIENKAKEYANITSPEAMQNIYANIYKEVADMDKVANANIEDISSSNLSYTMIEFYTLIAMSCLYGGILGMATINQALPNMSSNGKRVSVSPTPKGKVILSNLLARIYSTAHSVLHYYSYILFLCLK